MLRALVTLSIAGWFAPVEAAEIVLRDSAAPSGSIVRLGDVAEISGDDATRERLARMPLMPTPAEGVVQHLRSAAVRDLIAAQGEPMRDHRLRGATTVEVAAGAPSRGYAKHSPPLSGGGVRGGVTPETRRAPSTSSPFHQERGNETRRSATGFRAASTTPKRRVVRRQFVTTRERALVKARVRAAVEEWLTARRPDVTPLGLEGFELDDDQVQAVEALGQGALVASLIDRQAGAGKNRFRVATTNEPGGEAAEVGVSLVELPLAVVALEPIGRGELITASRVALRPLTLEQARDPKSLRAYVEVDSAVGMESSRAIRVGDPLSDDNCQGQLLVRRGETVSVLAGGGGVSVQIQALARGDGRRGDLVQVEAYDRSERFAARVVGRRELAIVSASEGEARLAAAATGGTR